jgi:hypothetical protein
VVPAAQLQLLRPGDREVQTVTTQAIEIESAGDPKAAAASEQPSETPAPTKAAKSGEDDLLAPLITPDVLPRVGTTPSWLTPARFTVGMVAAPVVLVASMAARAVWRGSGPTSVRARARPGRPASGR